MTDTRKPYLYTDRNGAELYDDDQLINHSTARVAILRFSDDHWHLDEGGHKRPFVPGVTDDGRLYGWTLYQPVPPEQATPAKTDARTLYPLADYNGVELYDGDRLESRSTKRIATLRYRKDDSNWTVDIGGHVRPFIPHNEEGRLLGWNLYQPVHVDPPPVKVSTPEQEAAIDAAVGIRGLPPIRLDLDVYALAAENAAREGVVLQAYIRRVLTDFLRGSIPGRQPDGYAYVYPDGLRFSNAERINGSKPVRSVPYYLGWPAALPPLPRTRVLASGTINGKREELRGWYEDDLKAWQAASTPKTGPEHRCDGCGSTTVGVHFQPCKYGRGPNE